MLTYVAMHRNALAWVQTSVPSCTPAGARRDFRDALDLTLQTLSSQVASIYHEVQTCLLTQPNRRFLASNITFMYT